MKKLFITFVILSGTIVINAQTAPNPFEKYGFKKIRAYSSSHGEFEEFHDNKDIVEIGSVLFDTKKNQVIGYAKEESENEVKASTPAMSIDPLCEKYYWISPYAYCKNNPISRIDPDGRDDYYSNNGSFLFRDDKETENIIIRQDNYYKKMMESINLPGMDLSNLPDHFDTPLADMTLSAEAYSNIFTDVMSKMEGVDTKKLLNESVSVIVINDDDFTYYDKNTYNDPSNKLFQNASISKSDGKFKITATLHPDKSSRDIFGTISNVQNILGAHEYIGHGVKGFGEMKTYEYQFKHPTWSKTTQNFQLEMLKNYGTYKK